MHVILRTLWCILWSKQQGGIVFFISNIYYRYILIVFPHQCCNRTCWKLFSTQSRQTFWLIQDFLLQAWDRACPLLRPKRSYIHQTNIKNSQTSYVIPDKETQKIVPNFHWCRISVGGWNEVYFCRPNWIISTQVMKTTWTNLISRHFVTCFLKYTRKTFLWQTSEFTPKKLLSPGRAAFVNFRPLTENVQVKHSPDGRLSYISQTNKRCRTCMSSSEVMKLLRLLLIWSWQLESKGQGNQALHSACHLVSLLFLNHKLVIVKRR